ncbi:hypothetical protein Bra471DRAFT_01517 [Bradyrhizobium sp. WSM471]|nr:hypothetical protein Bra471DRAFT_01517 [Bradyrhizobium sp. WSM471]
MDRSDVVAAAQRAKAAGATRFCVAAWRNPKDPTSIRSAI